MKRIFLFISLLISTAVFAQPFWNDIQAFKKKDSAQMPPKNAVLFIGSSSFTMWTDVAKAFPGYTIINRAFGGSTLVDQINYVNDIVFPYKPKQIVIYCGENDLAASDTVTARMVLNRLMQLVKMIRQKLPNVAIAYVSMKPSPSRQHLLRKMQDGNNAIEAFLKKSRNAAFIDVYHQMIDANKMPRRELFLDDELHMNANGYAIWQKEIEPFLLK